MHLSLFGDQIDTFLRRYTNLTHFTQSGYHPSN